MYQKENEKDNLFLFIGFIFVGVIIFLFFIIYCREFPEITISLLFVVILVVVGVKGVLDVKNRQNEIKNLIVNGKYLIGNLVSLCVPEYVCFTKGFKCAVFSCISETGRTYYFQSEPFNIKKNPFNKDINVKIYVDNLKCPKKYFVSEEYITS